LKNFTSVQIEKKFEKARQLNFCLIAITILSFLELKIAEAIKNKL